jgi:predicted DNA-binding transcriptional regulator AlpA
MFAEKEQAPSKLRFLTKKQVREKTTLSPAEIDRREHQHRFPKRHRLSDAPRGRVVWWEHEIDEWMELQAGSRAPAVSESAGMAWREHPGLNRAKAS